MEDHQEDWIPLIEAEMEKERADREIREWEKKRRLEKIRELRENAAWHIKKQNIPKNTTPNKLSMKQTPEAQNTTPNELSTLINRQQTLQVQNTTPSKLSTIVNRYQ